MKKFILVAFIAFIAFSIVSCSNDDNSPENISGTETAKVMAEFGNSFLKPNKTNAKSVERGSIPVAIDKITVVASNVSTPSFPQSTTVFNLVENGTGVETKFYIDGIAAGTNSFTATATTNGPKVSNATIYDDATNLALNTFNANKSVTPFAQYTATSSATINFKTPQTVAFNMGTSNGKSNTYIYTGPTITATNHKVTVTYQRFKADNTPIDSTAQLFDITGSKSLVCSWSDDLAVVGNYVSIDIEVYSPDGLIQEFSSNSKIVIKTSTTINTTIAITKDGITTSENEATFNFPAWIVEGN